MSETETGVSLSKTPVPVELERFRALYEQGESLYAGLTGLAEEVAGMRRDVAELKTYIEGLEEKAQAMASPEAMQEMMSKFMSGGI